MTWLAVEGYEGIYAVSDRGDVLSMNYAKSGLPGLMTPRLRRGYLSVCLSKVGEKERDVTVHSLVAHAFIGPRPLGYTINHIDGCKTNNPVTNIEYVTPSENKKHAFRLGLQCNKGEQHSQSKLTNVQVEQIRQRVARGESQHSIAVSMEVSQSCISLASRGLRWPHIKRLPVEGGVVI